MVYVQSLACRKITMNVIPGPFRRFATRVWQNARVNTVARATVYDV